MFRDNSKTINKGDMESHNFDFFLRNLHIEIEFQKPLLRHLQVKTCQHLKVDLFDDYNTFSYTMFHMGRED